VLSSLTTEVCRCLSRYESLKDINAQLCIFYSALFACFCFLIFYPFFQGGQLTPFAPMCGRPWVDGVGGIMFSGCPPVCVCVSASVLARAEAFSNWHAIGFQLMFICRRCFQYFDTEGWVPGRACSLQILSDEVLVLLSVWREVQIVLIWSS